MMPDYDADAARWFTLLPMRLCFDVADAPLPLLVAGADTLMMMPRRAALRHADAII